MRDTCTCFTFYIVSCWQHLRSASVSSHRALIQWITTPQILILYHGLYVSTISIHRYISGSLPHILPFDAFSPTAAAHLNSLRLVDDALFRSDKSSRNVVHTRPNPTLPAKPAGRQQSSPTPSGRSPWQAL